MLRSICFILLLCCACQTPKEAKAGWQKVFKNNANGQTVFGNKAQLIDAVRSGYPVRIGWGGNRVEHVTDAQFLTIFEGEVFAQIKSIVGQAPSAINDSVKIKFRPENHWTKIAGTNGYANGFMTNYFKDTIAGGNIDRYGETTWYVLYPAHTLELEARPLWKEGSPNWDTYTNQLDKH